MALRHHTDETRVDPTGERWKRLSKRLIDAKSPTYEHDRRVWNGLINKHPTAIVRCDSVLAVQDALAFARSRGLPVSVRGGGHGVAGHAIADGGVVLDMRGLQDVFVDPERKLVRVGSGALYRLLDAATQEHGLATTGGVFSKTGVAGLTLSGGMGWLMRHFGMACDNVAQVELVTAKGDHLVVNDEEHADLLWALRGGTGNFGAVTSFTYRLHHVGPEVDMLMVMYPMAQGREVMAKLREQLRDAPDELGVIAVYWTAPTASPIPPEVQNADIVAIVGCYSGHPAKASQILQPLKTLGEPLVDLSQRVPYTTMQRVFDDDYPDGRLYYWKSQYVSALTDDVLDVIHAFGLSRPSKLSSLDVWLLGGAVARVAPAHSPVANRDASHLIALEANWDNPDQTDANIAWARQAWTKLLPFARGTYLNFAGFGEERTQLLKKAYGASYKRLMQVKKRYDPNNVFASNINLKR